MLQLINYSDKAVALVGDTREIKDELKRIGGRFNAKLSCGVGWIFSNAKRAELEALVGRKPEDHYAHSELRHPAVYCGTYGKYAGGSIKGAWIDLTTFASGEDAIKWMCEVLHKDESDPELMMQDFEYFPEWMYAECMGVAQIDEILEWWKNEGSKPAKAPKIDKALLDEYRAEMERVGLEGRVIRRHARQQTGPQQRNTSCRRTSAASSVILSVWRIRTTTSAFRSAIGKVTAFAQLCGRRNGTARASEYRMQTGRLSRTH